MSTVSFAQIDSSRNVKFMEWKFVSVGALLGYQYQKSSLLELGAAANLEYELLYLSSSFSVENEFGKKITGTKGNFQAGLGLGRMRVYLFGGISYLNYKQKTTSFSDKVLRAEAGIYIPGMWLFRSGRNKQYRFNLKVCYTNNSNLDPIEIDVFGRHGINVSLLLGYGFHLKPKSRN